MIVFEFDLADLDLRSFFDDKVDGDAGRRNLPDLGADSRKLASVL